MMKHNSNCKFEKKTKSSHAHNKNSIMIHNLECTGEFWGGFNCENTLPLCTYRIQEGFCIYKMQICSYCRPYKWDVTHIYLHSCIFAIIHRECAHIVAHVNGSCPTCTWIVSYIWMSHVMYTFIVAHWQSFMCTTICAFSHSISQICSMPISYVTSLDHKYDMTHVYVWHDSFISMTRLMYTCDMTHSYPRQYAYFCIHIHLFAYWICKIPYCASENVRIFSHMWMSHVSHIHESCHRCEWAMLQTISDSLQHDSFTCIYMSRVIDHIWLSIFHIWLSLQHDSFTYIYMSRVIDMVKSRHAYEWVMSQICMSHVTHMKESCHIYEWVMSCIWRSHVTYTNESCHTYEWVMSHIQMSHITHTNESCHTYEYVISHTHICR